ncbi:MAG: hypothetical protein KIT31_08080 [Deltaproteobacteria bacterium]|nr:hypothetical protein [Deltaproteobacteria bacterium]
MSKLLAAIAVAALCTAAAPRPADACSCIGPRTYVLPNGAVAGTNTHLFVFIPESRFGENMSPFALRLKGTKVRIDVDEKSSVSATQRIVEIIPRAVLKAKADYELVDAANNVVAAFLTGDRPDPAPGAWKGVARAEYLRHKHAGGGSCRTGSPFVRVTLAESAGEAGQLYGVWVAGSDGKIDYTVPPATYDFIGGAELELGTTSICSSRSFEIPKRDSMKLGLRRVSLSGVASAPSEVTVDLRRPTEIGR